MLLAGTVKATLEALIDVSTGKSGRPNRLIGLTHRPAMKENLKIKKRRRNRFLEPLFKKLGD